MVTLSILSYRPSDENFRNRNLIVHKEKVDYIKVIRHMTLIIQIKCDDAVILAINSFHAGSKRPMRAFPLNT